jgi:CheY-like chemotaxis protein
LLDAELFKDKKVSNITKVKILVVEDDFNNQRVISAMLNKLNMEVEICNNGMEALKFLEKNQVDVILMDCQMPLMDGYTTTTIIKDLIHNKQIKYIPIIAITAYASKEDKEKCLEAGMCDYLAKPIHFKEISEKINKWLSKKQGVCHRLFIHS